MDWPNDEAAIAEVFARLPAEITVNGEAQRGAGAAWPDPGYVLAVYGRDPGGLVHRHAAFAVDVTTRSVPSRDAADLVAAAVALNADPRPNALRSLDDSGRDGDTVWVRFAIDRFFPAVEPTPGGAAATPGPPRPAYFAWWGETSSRWAFGASGMTREGRDALVAALVAAAGGDRLVAGAGRGRPNGAGPLRGSWATRLTLLLRDPVERRVETVFPRAEDRAVFVRRQPVGDADVAAEVAVASAAGVALRLLPASARRPRSPWTGPSHGSRPGSSPATVVPRLDPAPSGLAGSESTARSPAAQSSRTVALLCR